MPVQQVKSYIEGAKTAMAIRILLSRKLGELRWTQADLARKTGIRPATINELYHELNDRVNLVYLDFSRIPGPCFRWYSYQPLRQNIRRSKIDFLIVFS